MTSKAVSKCPPAPPNSAGSQQVQQPGLAQEPHLGEGLVVGAVAGQRVGGQGVRNPAGDGAPVLQFGVAGGAGVRDAGQCGDGHDRAPWIWTSEGFRQFRAPTNLALALPADCRLAAAWWSQVSWPPGCHRFKHVPPACGARPSRGGTPRKTASSAGLAAARM